jgi:hypothetical protein
MSKKYPIWIKQESRRGFNTHLINISNVDNIIPVIKQAFEHLDYDRFDAKEMQFKRQLDKNS